MKTISVLTAAAFCIALAMANAVAVAGEPVHIGSHGATCGQLPAGPDGTPVVAGAHVTWVGIVHDVHVSARQNTFLNIGDAYPTQAWSAWLRPDDRERFGDLTTLVGKTVKFSGVSREYRCKAQLLLDRDSSIEVVQ